MAPQVPRAPSCFPFDAVSPFIPSFYMPLRIPVPNCLGLRRFGSPATVGML